MDERVDLRGSLASLHLIEDFPVLGFNAGPALSPLAAFNNLAPRDQFTEVQRRIWQLIRQKVLVFAKVADGDTPNLKSIWWRKEDFLFSLNLWANLTYANGEVSRYGVVVSGDPEITDVRLVGEGPFQFELVTVVFEDAYTPSDPDLLFQLYRPNGPHYD